jgi:glycosyltransferase involved in cell wall biosynthesis
MRVSILTPTHNRSEKLKRLYLSLEKSTYKDFEWVIVNDGSSDNTEDVVKEIILTSTFPITYVFQEKSGKHVAMNKLYDLAKGEYCFQIDDDDELLPDAMEKGLEIWDSMTPNQRDSCWCVCGRHIHYKTREMIGEPFPVGINEMTQRKKNKILSSLSGDKCGMQKVALVRQYKLPEVKGCNFFPEIYLWRQLNALYDQFYVNEIFGVCHVQEGKTIMNFDFTQENARMRFVIYEYLLKKTCICKSKLLSKRHFIEIYNYIKYRNMAEINRNASKELSGINQVLVTLAEIPFCIVNCYFNKR